MKQLSCLIILLFTIAVATGCDPAGSSGPASFTSNDGSVTVNTPAGWSNYDSHDDGDLEIGNVSNDCYFLLLSENRSDYAGTLQEHSDDTRSMLLQGATNVTQTGPKQLTINGFPAIQYNISATVDRLNIVYLHTTIQTNEKYHQTLAWTSASGFTKHESELQAIIASLKDSSATPATPDAEGGDEDGDAE